MNPINKKLYNKIKKDADKKFLSNGVYKSSWIVKQYKKSGGKYTGFKNKLTGLQRWYKEKWIDLNTGKSCGRKSQKEKVNYPLCRPSVKVTNKTPLTADEINKKNLKKLIYFKNKYLSLKNIRFQSSST